MQLLPNWDPPPSTPSSAAPQRVTVASAEPILPPGAVLAPAAIGGRGVDATEKKKVYRLLQTKGGRQATTNAARATHNHRSYHSDPFPEAPDFAVPSHLGRALR